MDTSSLNLVIIFLLFLAANFPFFTNNLFGIFNLGWAKKPIILRFFEMFFLSFLIFTFAIFLESYVGDVFNQGWQFYVINVCLIIVLGFPGFVYCYLIRKK
tara:strand:- start:586 stop:888 length:303 start_codon:yes stop_codon:yes gene_type:complete